MAYVVVKGGTISIKPDATSGIIGFTASPVTTIVSVAGSKITADANNGAALVDDIEKSLSSVTLSTVSTDTPSANGTAKFSSLSMAELSTKTTRGKKAVVLDSSTFTLEFEIVSPPLDPAKQNAPDANWAPGTTFAVEASFASAGQTKLTSA